MLLKCYMVYHMPKHQSYRRLFILLKCYMVYHMPTRKKKTKKYPPAYYRYKEEHPTISICLTKELKEAIDLRRGDMSYGGFVKELIEGNIPQIQEATPIWYLCNVCQKPIVISPNSGPHRAVIKYMRRTRWGHTECHERSKERRAALRKETRSQKLRHHPIEY